MDSGLELEFYCKGFVFFFLFLLLRLLTIFWVFQWQQLTGINFICAFFIFNISYIPNSRLRSLNISLLRNSKFFLNHNTNHYTQPTIIQTFFIQAGIKDGFIITFVTPPPYNSNFSLTLKLLPTFPLRIIADVVNTVMTIVGVQLIDRVGRRRLLIIGAIGMCICEFIVAIVGVTVGNIAADGSVNSAAQKVLIAFVCLCVCFSLDASNFIILLTRPFLQLYCFLRYLLGTCCLGINWRTLRKFFFRPSCS